MVGELAGPLATQAPDAGGLSGDQLRSAPSVEPDAGPRRPWPRQVTVSTEDRRGFAHTPGLHVDEHA
jgi:hypothetical protein